MRRLAVVFAVAVSSVQAHEITPVLVSNDQHSATQAAENMLLDADCARTAISRSTKFRLVQDAKGVIIYGADFRVTCVLKKITPPPVVVTPPPVVVKPNDAKLTWDTPLTREDGSRMSVSEIAGYYLYHNGTRIKLAPINSLVIPDLPPGRHEFYIQTIDTNGLVSSNSATVEKSL